MCAKDTGVGMEEPCDREVIRAGMEALICRSGEVWDKKEVDEPSDAAEAGGTEPDSASDSAPVIEAVGAEKAKDPEGISDEFAVGRFSSCLLYTSDAADD